MSQQWKIIGDWISRANSWRGAGRTATEVNPLSQIVSGVALLGNKLSQIVTALKPAASKPSGPAGLFFIQACYSKTD
ncbi:unnamed protein product [Merluccius merluccius]